MLSIPLASISGTLLGWLMAFLSLFLIMLILIQRGKGGGLAGALGGPGGQSAFGSKAGDTFTVITVVVASIWGFTCAFTMWLLGTHSAPALTDSSISAGPGTEQVERELDPGLPPIGGDDIPANGGIGGESSGGGLEGLADTIRAAGEEAADESESSAPASLNAPKPATGDTPAGDDSTADDSTADDSTADDSTANDSSSGDDE